jgi:Zn-dependent M28 family amino/carboxypeptidase
MRKTSAAIATAAILAATAITAQRTADQPSDETLFRTIVKELSDDSFGGRKPMTPNEAPVINYIASQFAAAGLQPAANGSFFQKVPLLSVATRIKNNEIIVKGSRGPAKRLRYWDDVVAWTMRAAPLLRLRDSEAIFAGFGIVAPEYGWDDYAGINVKGKTVIVMVNDPGYYDSTLFRGKNMTYYGRWTYKFEEAARQGASAILIIHDAGAASYDWSVVQNSRTGGSLRLYAEGDDDKFPIYQGWLTASAAETLFNAAGISLDNSQAMAKRKGFAPVPLKVRISIESANRVEKGESANVAGILPGTDLRNEYILYSAHWDHLGTGQAVDGDSIYNGASDNASGIAAITVLARRFAREERKPRRSIIFLAVTAEESGLLGSQYYSEFPLYPLAKTAACLNMDGYGDRHRTSDVTLSAAGKSDLDNYVIDAAAAQGRNVRLSTSDPGGGYYRSDHYNFARKGVAAVLAKGGRNFVDTASAGAYRRAYHSKSNYHQPSDEYGEWWNLSGTLEDIYLFYAIGLRLANDGVFPRQYESK